MTLQHLFLELMNLHPHHIKKIELWEQEVSGLFFDARKTQPNSVFVAVKGNAADGHQYLEQAIQNGAIALVVQDSSIVPHSFEGLVLTIPDSRKALDILAATYYSDPSIRLFCIGVTGTNGKTSITYLLEHILNENKKMMGVMGTVNHRIGEVVWESQMTTPDPVLLQQRLQEFLKHSAFGAVMEVSSHALDQKRVESVHFNTVIFTNLTQDHLDYHKDMQSYFQSKQRLFTDLMWASIKRPLFAIINVDDVYGRRLKVADTVLSWTYGQQESDFQFSGIKMSFEGTEFTLKTPVETFQVKTNLTGLHNVYNVVASIAAAITCGVTIEQSLSALKRFYGIPGRLQKVDSHNSKTVFVDYAHTPDALENTLQSLVKIKKENQLKQNIICVFGCGGDRDKGKRPLMAEIAAKYSDFVFVTSDNPRTEIPEEILKDIVQGIPKAFKSFEVEVDRETAIKNAIDHAEAGDVILIAGKGHEDYQIIGTEKRHFSDIEVAQKYLGIY